MRTVRSVVASEKVNMGGIIIDQALPVSTIDAHDPFLLIHHWSNTFKGEQKQKNVGVGPHPHRGFSPVTVILKGGIHHRDSLGNDSVVQAGGVQWMNAGKGVTHSERPTAEIAKNGGEFEIIQFWVNTKSDLKLISPEYFAIEAKDIPKVTFKDDAKLSVISGSYDGTSGIIETNNHINVFRIDMKKNAQIELAIPEDHNTLLYQIEGESIVNMKQVNSDKTLVVFRNDHHSIMIKANKDSKYLLLSALPLSEKVSQYGPFVMNNTTQIMEAIRDAQMGKMGVLIEEFE